MKARAAGLFGFALLLLALVGACTSTPGGAKPVGTDTIVGYVHDDAHGVGCWYVQSNGPALSCIPDKQYTR